MKKIKAQSLRNITTVVVGLIITIGFFLKLGSSSLGNLSSFGIGYVASVCPLGALETACASIIPGFQFAVRAIIGLVIVALLCVLFGRFFCAWICPVPLIQHIFSRKKTRDRLLEERKEAVQIACDEAEARKAAAIEAGNALKPNNFSFDSRYAVLVGALASAAIFGFPVFCLICPVGLTFASILSILRLFAASSAEGGLTIGVIIFPVILLLEILLLRKWCSKICPLGALMSLFSGANKFFRPSIDNDKCLMTTKGVNCKICYASCPVEIDPRSLETSPVSMNNCSKCRECADHCPASAISFPFVAK